MGRTLHTYRIRINNIRDHMMKLARMLCNQEDIEDYEKLWESSQSLSGPASILPWVDTRTVIAYCMILELMKQMDDLEKVFH